MRDSAARRARILGSASRYSGSRSLAARSLAAPCLALVLAVLAVSLGACGHHPPDTATESEINVYPTNYKSDILGAMHAYLSNPTGIRDAAISDPALKTVANVTRYTACLKFNAKKDGSHDYAGARTIAAVFQVGRFDRFVDGTNAKETSAKDLCTGVTYAPFPELQKLSP
ncbi:MAG: hypothetical protein WB495_12650 [Xanthobacteraceae bacterium]|jgi:hypothetical protein